MTSKFLSLVAGVAALGLVGAAANAAEPMQLTEVQMDNVTAGWSKYKKVEPTHFQFIKIIVSPDIELKDDVAKSVSAAQATAPSYYNAFTFTDNTALIDRTWNKVTSTSLGEAVAVVSKKY
jgi:hypothetical protein